MKNEIHELIRESCAAISHLHYFLPEIQNIASLVGISLINGYKIMACGNGGSAADASHFMTEIACRFNGDRRPWPAIDLTSNGSLLTANVNDYGIDEIFARQVEAFGKHGDLLVGISTSGNSSNVLQALLRAKNLGLHTVAFLGRDGGKCAGKAELEIIVPLQVTARIQEAHHTLIHIICALIDPILSR